MAKKYDFDDSDGVWRTVGGRRIFIKNGQDLASAMIESGKFKNDARTAYRKAKKELKDTDEDKEIKGRVDELQREIESGRNSKEKTERLKDELQQYKDTYKLSDEGKKYYDEKYKQKEDVDKEYNDRYEKETKEKSIEANKPAGQKTADLIKESGVKTFADEIKEIDKKLANNEVLSEEEYTKKIRDIQSKPSYQKKMDEAVAELEKKGSNEKYTVDYFKKQGVEIKDKAPEGWQKLEGATTAPNGYEWYSNGKSRFGGEYKNALVKVADNKIDRNIAFRYANDLNSAGYYNSDDTHIRNEIKDKYGVNTTTMLAIARLENLNDKGKLDNDVLNNELKNNPDIEKLIKKGVYEPSWNKNDNQKTTNETMNNAIREKAGNKYATAKREGFGNYNKDNIPVYNNKIDYTGDFGRNADLSTLSTKELNEAIKVQQQKLDEVNSEKIGDQRTRNGRMDKIFNTARKQQYEEGVKLLKEEAVKRENAKYPEYEKAGYGVKYYSPEDAMKDPNSKMNKYIREKAYKKYLKEHPGSKMSFNEFKDMKK